MHWFLKFIFGIKLYMFRTVLLSIIRSFSLYKQQWYMSYRFVDSLRAGSGRSSVLILIEVGYLQGSYQDARSTKRKLFSQTCKFVNMKSHMWFICVHCIHFATKSPTRSFHICLQSKRSNSVLILFASCQQTCMTYTIDVCTMKNSWWWTEKLSESYRLLFQK